MRSVIQRVSQAHVEVEGTIIGSINQGLLVLLGVAEEDDMKDLAYMVDKTLNLRIFQDQQDKMNLSVQDIQGEILVISQFTIQGDARKGRRPSFINAGNPEKAASLYEQYIEELKKSGLKIACGQFAAMMKVHLINDGPVTILLDSQKLF